MTGCSEVGFFFFFLTLCSPESHALVAGRNYRAASMIYSSATASDVPALTAREGDGVVWWKGWPAIFSPCGQDKGDEQSKRSDLCMNRQPEGNYDVCHDCLLQVCIHYYALNLWLRIYHNNTGAPTVGQSLQTLHRIKPLNTGCRMLLGWECTTF